MRQLRHILPMAILAMITWPAHAALPTRLLIDVQPSTSSDSYGGGFNAQNSNMATDGAATSATGTSPVFSSASYNFAARDVGAWVFIKSGTNTLPGWYKISSVAANAATLDATAGHAILFGSTSTYALSTSTANGCATTASPTSITWTVDYTQNGGIAFTDLVAASTTTFTSAANPIGKNMVGNLVQITSGTSWNTVFWEVSSVSGTTGTAANFSAGTTIATNGSTGGTGNCGGALASPGQAGAIMTVGSFVFIKGAGGSPDYTVTSATNNVAGGCLSGTARDGGGTGLVCSNIKGYGTYRLDRSTKPKIKAGSSISSFKLVTVNTFCFVENLDLDCNSYTSSTGLDLTARANAYLCNIRNWTTNGIIGNSSGNTSTATKCFLTGGSGSAIKNCNALQNVVAGCTATGIDNSSFDQATIGNIVANCSGASSDGITYSTEGFVTGNTIYNCGRDGLRIGNLVGMYANNLSYGSVNSFNNTGGMSNTPLLINCAGGGGSTSTYASNFGKGQLVNCVTLTADPFVNSGATISTYDDAVAAFQLNSTAGGGALARAAGIVNYADIGAAQHQASGGAPTFSPGIYP